MKKYKFLQIFCNLCTSDEHTMEQCLYMKDVKFKKYPCQEVATNMAQVETWVVLEKKHDI